MNEEKTIAVRKTQKALTEDALSREQFLVAKFLSGLKFRPRLWGVDEGEAWKALEKLTVLYEDALTVERSRRELAEHKLEALRFRKEETDGQ